MEAEDIVEYLERELEDAIKMWKYCEVRGHEDTTKYIVRVCTFEEILETINPEYC